MKAKLKIFIDINTEESGESMSGPINPYRMNGDQAIVIRKDSLENYDVLGALTHELGHIVGRLLRTPASAARDRAATALVAMGYGGEIPVSVQAPSEVEAWTIAEKIAFYKDKAEALQGYMEAAKLEMQEVRRQYASMEAGL
jgi:hypothetical protein